MTNEERMIEGALRTWKLNETRLDRFFHPLSEEQLQYQVAPDRNRLIYLWGHLSATHDALFPLLGLGPRLFPELEGMFLSCPDRSNSGIYSGKELKQIAGQVHHSLWVAFNELKPGEWLEKHTSVTAAEFATDPSRNRYSVVLNRTAHMAFHLGQAALVKFPR